MLFGSQKTSTTSCSIGDQVQNCGSSGGPQRSDCLLSKRRNEPPVMDSNDHDDDGRQFSPRAGGNNYNNQHGNNQQTLSVALSAREFSADSCHDKDDRLGQSELAAAPDKKRADRTNTDYSSSLAAKVGLNRQTADSDNESDRPFRGRHCYKHRQMIRRESTKPALTKSTAAIDEFNHPTASKAASIDERCRTLSKPMGQQVLSLMMLDVGLMPSDNCLSQQSQRQQTLHRVSSASHVRVQSPPERELLKVAENSAALEGCLFRDASHGDSDNVDRENLRFAREPTAGIPVNEMMLRLRLSDLNLDSHKTTKSTSLPSSPRRRIHRQHRPRLWPAHGLPCDETTAERANSRNSAARHSRACFSPANRLLSASSSSSSSSGHEEHGYRLQRAAADRCRGAGVDSLSVSSSCSSLNHNYPPPLLALSNQLDDLNLRELRMLHQQQRHAVGSIGRNGSIPHLLNAAAAAAVATTTTNTDQRNTNNNSAPVLATNRCQQRVAEAHKSNCSETRTNNCRCDHQCCSGAADCFDACRSSPLPPLTAKTSDSDSGYGNISDDSPGARHTDRFAAASLGAEGETCSDQSSR